MIETYYYPSATSSVNAHLSMEEIKHALQNPDGLLWVNLIRPDLNEINQILRDTFQFHPLAIEDCLSNGYQTPKVDDFSSYLFLVVHAVPSGGTPINLDNTVEINLFLGANYLVSCANNDNVPPIQAVKERLTRDDRLIKNGADFLCHSILDHLVDAYLPLIDGLDEKLEFIEDQVLQQPTSKVLPELLEIKHSLMALRRIVSPQREVMNRLSRDDFPVIDRQSRIYFRDVYDHLVRLQDLSDTLRDIVSGVLDIYLNSTSLRLNEVMKALTVVSTIFLPLSFVAGVYGMNFHYMPELSWRFGYLFVWVIFVTIFVGMLIWFKRRNWF
mgnify:CR=1 FL=1